MLHVGYLEGTITQPLIYDFQMTFNALYPNSSSLNQQVIKWFETHISWLEAQVANYKGQGMLDPFWNYIDLLLSQLRGMVVGYNQYAPPGQVNYTPPSLLSPSPSLSLFPPPPSPPSPSPSPLPSLPLPPLLFSPSLLSRLISSRVLVSHNYSC